MSPRLRLDHIADELAETGKQLFKSSHVAYCMEPGRREELLHRNTAEVVTGEVSKDLPTATKSISRLWTPVATSS